MAGLQLITAAATVLGFLAVEIRRIIPIFLIVVFLFALLWIKRGVLLPWIFDTQEVQRQKRNSWWLQAYHEERVGKRPTGILRRTSSSTSTSSYSNAESEKDVLVKTDGREQEVMNSSIIPDKEEMIEWFREKKVVKHVRFEAPLTTTLSAFPALFGEDDYRFMIEDQKTCHYFEQFRRT